jgi:tetratricopeptide (TPR) repeat protein
VVRTKRPRRARILLLPAAALACALLLRPGRAEAASFYGLIRKGNRFFRNELFKEALGYYRRGGEKNRRAIEPAFNAGASLYKMEDYVRSFETLTGALGSARKPEVRSNILYNMGNCGYQRGDYRLAAECYREGLALTPYDLNLKYNLELALRKLERKSEEAREDGGSPDAQNSDRPEGGEGGGGTGDRQGAAGGREAGPGQAKPGRAGSQTTGSDGSPAPLGREEAERLLRSLNTDQSKIVGDYIRQKLGLAENEKDW